MYNQYVSLKDLLYISFYMALKISTQIRHEKGEYGCISLFSNYLKSFQKLQDSNIFMQENVVYGIPSNRIHLAVENVSN